MVISFWDLEPVPTKKNEKRINELNIICGASQQDKILGAWESLEIEGER